MQLLENIWLSRNYILRPLIPIIFLPILFIRDALEIKCAYGVCIIITFWLLEVFPLSITALLPLALFPLLGVISSATAAKAFINSTMMVFLSSMIAATAVEKSNLHMRIALRVILLFGTSIQRFLFGFMITTTIMSMCISNIAAAALMLPLINAAFDKLISPLTCSMKDDDSLGIFIQTHSNLNVQNNEQIIASQEPVERTNKRYSILTLKQINRLRKGILLGNCYASIIAGTATLTGSSTNLVLNAFLYERPVSYSDWFFFNIPGVIIMLVLTWIFFCIFYVNHTKDNAPTNEQEEQIYKLIQVQYRKLGPIIFHEIAVLFLFFIMIIAWILRAPDFMSGWAMFFSQNDIDDQVPAILIVILLFAIPRDLRNISESPALLEWRDVHERVPWGVILLLGGSFSLAKACEESGLSMLIAEKLMVLSSDFPLSQTLLLLSIISMILTELTSNVSTGTIILPVVKKIALSMNLNPLLLMLPMTLTSNYGFMLPVASAMTAIFYESGHMRMHDMIIPGFFIKLICFSVHITMLYTWGYVIFDFNETSSFINTTIPVIMIE